MHTLYWLPLERREGVMTRKKQAEDFKALIMFHFLTSVVINSYLLNFTFMFYAFFSVYFLQYKMCSHGNMSVV